MPQDEKPKHHDGQSPHPPLLQDRSFWGMTATQFLGAFNDNIFKQMVLLMAVAVPAAGAAGEPQDLQGEGLFIFSIPFLLFSGIAGFFSERYGKRGIIVLCKLAEIVVMLAGMAAFAAYGAVGITGLFVVLFVMGSQSAFFGPGKYGVLPELFRGRDLPQANGIFLMTTFLAIIFGTALAGLLKMQFDDKLWMAAGVCVAIAALGTITSLLVRSVPAANPQLKLAPSAFYVPEDVQRFLRRDPPLLFAILASSMFWLVGGIVHPSVNSVGIDQLQLGDLLTSLLVAAMGVGIALGCVLAGLLSRERVSALIVRLGGWGIVGNLGVLWLLLSVPIGQRAAPEVVFGICLALLISLGLFAGMFAVPLQVFMQSRPPAEQKGRTIATMNLANWIAIVVSALIYLAFDKLLDLVGWPRSTLFALTALLMLPVALLYRPNDASLGE